MVRPAIKLSVPPPVRVPALPVGAARQRVATEIVWPMIQVGRALKGSPPAPECLTVLAVSKMEVPAAQTPHFQKHSNGGKGHNAGMRTQPCVCALAGWSRHSHRIKPAHRSYQEIPVRR